MHKTDLSWGGTWGGTANFLGGMCPPRPPLGDATAEGYMYIIFEFLKWRV